MVIKERRNRRSFCVTEKSQNVDVEDFLSRNEMNDETSDASAPAHTPHTVETEIQKTKIIKINALDFINNKF